LLRHHVLRRGNRGLLYLLLLRQHAVGRLSAVRWKLEEDPEQSLSVSRVDLATVL